MDYKAKIKEKMSKLLFLEMNKDGFKENVGIPSYVAFKNKDLYLPISSEYISSNVNDEIKIKNLPIYYFIEGMFTAIGADEKLRFNEDYELILDYIKDTEICIKSLISKKIEDKRYLDAYLLLKGYYTYSKDLDVMKRILLVGETIREEDSSFKDLLLEDIDYCINNNLKIAEPYLYQAIILKNDGDFKAARVAINEYLNKGGKVTEEVEIIKTDIQNISDYENAIEYLAEDPTKSIEILLRLAEEFEENPLIYYYLGIGFRKLEDYNQAIYYLKESVKRESGILEVIVELGLNYACINEFEEAIKFFKKAFEASRDVEICTNIVMCYLNLNDLENAKLHLDIAKNLNPDDEIVKQLETMMNKE
ncbi:tetratricopeptide repeat protein [Clostridium sp. 1001271B_151109_B4]|uniref:tetratricopeptide repeat protein n=1 Tax=Clostridium sp. 1001271B_151109_B4 TaxID=2787148 RepID=UPI0018ABF4D0|nr:tetratricopeptide repeat protein [Clostridium sp. 1001271B_151109_B4]